jgi:hypothetical protein
VDSGGAICRLVDGICSNNGLLEGLSPMLALNRTL